MFTIMTNKTNILYLLPIGNCKRVLNHCIVRLEKHDSQWLWALNAYMYIVSGDNRFFPLLLLLPYGKYLHFDCLTLYSYFFCSREPTAKTTTIFRSTDFFILFLKCWYLWIPQIFCIHNMYLNTKTSINACIFQDV